MQFSTKHSTINIENIKEMVIAFYTKILKEDNEVTKVFVDQFGDDLNGEHWQEHIEILTNFWAKMTLDDETYTGNPLQAHFDLPLSKEMFSTWLKMFFEVVDSMYVDRLAIVFKSRAENIAMNFIRNLNL